MSALIIMLCYNVNEKLVIFMRLIHYINGKKDNTYNNLENLYDKKEKKYKFFLDNISNYIYITDRLIFIRESDEYKFELVISKNSSCSLTLNKENKLFDIKVISSSYCENDKYIDIKYELETDSGLVHHIILEIEE